MIFKLLFNSTFRVLSVYLVLQTWSKNLQTPIVQHTPKTLPNLVNVKSPLLTLNGLNGLHAHQSAQLKMMPLRELELEPESAKMTTTLLVSKPNWRRLKIARSTSVRHVVHLQTTVPIDQILSVSMSKRTVSQRQAVNAEHRTSKFCQVQSRIRNSELPYLNQT